MKKKERAIVEKIGKKNRQKKRKVKRWTIRIQVRQKER